MLRSSRAPRHARSSRAPLVAVFAALLGLLLAGCTATGVIITPTDTVPAGPTATTGAAATNTPSGGIPVRVFFSKHPETDGNVSAVFPVNRTSPTQGVGTYAIQQLIQGPTASEAASGYFTELTASIGGSSNCGGPDFQYSIDNATHTGTLRFCRPITLAGDLTGGRIKAEITATLTQFPNVTKVIILTNTGHCFDDLSGADMCLH